MYALKVIRGQRSQNWSILNILFLINHTIVFDKNYKRSNYLQKKSYGIFTLK